MMAAKWEPPPLGDGKHTDFEELEDGEDLFTSAVSMLESSPSSPKPASLPAEDISANSNSPKPTEVVLDNNIEDLFTEGFFEQPRKGNYPVLRIFSCSYTCHPYFTHCS